MKKLVPPLIEDAVRKLKVGDEIQISGVIYTARDMAHKRMCETIRASAKLPFDINGAIIYFMGPTPARPGKVIGAAGSTTSSRMDDFSPTLIEAGLCDDGKGLSQSGCSRRNEKIRRRAFIHYRRGRGAPE